MRSEEVNVRRLLEYLGRYDAHLSFGIPDSRYLWQDRRWFVEVTSASVRHEELNEAYRRRLAEDPTSFSTPSSSGMQVGVDLVTDLRIRENVLSGAIAQSIQKKRSK